MPKHEQSFSINADKATAFAISYEVFNKLKWVVTHAGEDRLLGEESGKGLSKVRQIIVTIKNNSIDVSSETIDDQLMDIGGRNKKNVTAFIEQYAVVKDTIDHSMVSAHTTEIDNVRIATAEVIEQELKNAAEIEAAMKMGSSNLYVTYSIIAINVVVFILMAMQGAGVMEVNGLVHLKWGSNFGPLTFTGDWWRLLTNVFIHFGIIHLAMNMYALYSIGIYLEPMLGKVKYITAYLCCGILASVASLWWHTTPANSAGASGAIFGLYGLFLAMLTTDLIPAAIRKGLLTNIGVFVAYNLFYGLKGGIDNSAHIGGLLSGLAIGYLYVLALKKEKQDQPLRWVIPVIILLTLGGSFFYLEQHKGSIEERIKIENELQATGNTSIEKFNAQYDAVLQLQDEALVPLKDSALAYDNVLLTKLTNTSLPAWTKAEGIAESMGSLNVPPQFKDKLTVLKKYIHARKEQITLLKELIGNNTPESIRKIDSSTSVINELIQTLNKL